MAEFLFRVHDHDSEPGTRLGRGDCVFCTENGWPWSQEELTNPAWRIVKCPDMSLEEAQSYLVEDPGDENLGFLPQRRKYMIDQSKFIYPTTLTFVNDDSRQVPFLVVDATRLRNVIVERPPLLIT